MVLNYGRRGLTVLLYHFGAWEDTPEVFLKSWYRYQHSSEFEVLDDAEPIMCFLDSPLILAELSLWRQMVSAARRSENIDFESAYATYLDAPAVSFG
ncbi:MAG: hypothetical protein J0H98_05045 [Solirubrobacterales bacterium]|nr:hypothetical protein [Solirubrobacterales bacterium]